MDPIPVPAPPRSAYNPNRRVSDLILGQLKHFQHVEGKHGELGIDPTLARDIHTEAGAARYVAAITRALRNRAPQSAQPAQSVQTQPPQAAAPPPPALTVVPPRSRGGKRALAIAAVSSSPAEEPTHPEVLKKPARSSVKRKK